MGKHWNGRRTRKSFDALDKKLVLVKRMTTVDRVHGDQVIVGSKQTSPKTRNDVVQCHFISHPSFLVIYKSSTSFAITGLDPRSSSSAVIMVIWVLNSFESPATGGIVNDVTKVPPARQEVVQV